MNKGYMKFKFNISTYNSNSLNMILHIMLCPLENCIIFSPFLFAASNNFSNYQPTFLDDFTKNIPLSTLTKK